MNQGNENTTGQSNEKDLPFTTEDNRLPRGENVYTSQNRREAGESDVVFVVEDGYTRKHLFLDCEQVGWVFVGEEVYPLYRRDFDSETKEEIIGQFYFIGDEIKGQELIDESLKMSSEVSHGDGPEYEAVKERVSALRRRLTEGEGSVGE